MRLDPYLKREGRGALIKLAAAVGVTPSTVSKWRHEHQIPSLIQAFDVQRKTGGRVRAYDLLPSKKAG
jgi:transposase-like protein